MSAKLTAPGRLSRLMKGFFERPRQVSGGEICCWTLPYLLLSDAPHLLFLSLSLSVFTAKLIIGSTGGLNSVNHSLSLSLFSVLPLINYFTLWHHCAHPALFFACRHVCCG